ncbi:MAG TPA: hypothetical protein VFS21_29820 [Roseiflexaceae bacterium]|nr:hypothetical protein [Roseiflexaceae bacterium]
MRYRFPTMSTPRHHGRIGGLAGTQLLFHEPDNGINGGGTGGAGGTGAGNGGQQGGQGGQDPTQAFQNLLARNNNDGIRLAEQLYRENHDLREQRRTLQGQVPAQGAVVLTGDDATAWQGYRQLGDLTAVQTAIQERATAQGELAKLQRSVTLRDVADLAGYDREVLTTIGGELTYIIKDEQVEGKATKQVYVKDGDQETAITKYAEQKWQKFMPSLKLAPATGGAPPRGTPAPTTRTTQGQQQQGQQPAGEAPRRSGIRL